MRSTFAPLLWAANPACKPADTAYGPCGAGKGVIPPHAHLIFEIELIDILP